MCNVCCAPTPSSANLVLDVLDGSSDELSPGRHTHRPQLTTVATHTQLELNLQHK